MSCSRPNTKKINRLCEHCLQIIYMENQLLFEELIEKDNSVSIHHTNIQFLSIEIHKIINGLSYSHTGIITAK